jgi:hypothetical protein
VPWERAVAHRRAESTGLVCSAERQRTLRRQGGRASEPPWELWRPPPNPGRFRDPLSPIGRSPSGVYRLFPRYGRIPGAERYHGGTAPAPHQAVASTVLDRVRIERLPRRGVDVSSRTRRRLPSRTAEHTRCQSRTVTWHGCPRARATFTGPVSEQVEAPRQDSVEAPGAVPPDPIAHQGGRLALVAASHRDVRLRGGEAPKG